MCFLVNSPDGIRDVLVTHERQFSRGSARRSPVLGNGILTSDGEHHRRQRRLIRPAFHKERIASLAAEIVEHGERVAAEWIDGTTIEMLPAMRRLSLDVMLGALVGSDAIRHDVGVAMTDAIDGLGRFGLRRKARRARARVVAQADRRRHAQAAARLDATLYRLIAERRRDGNDRGDMLSTLIDARDDAGGMTDLDVRDELATLIEAGHIAVGNALAWAWYLVAAHPAVERRLHDELSAVLGERRPALEDLPRLAYTEMVFLEALRLYPPAWLIERRALEDVDIGGRAIPAGSTVFVSPYTVHRDPRHYPHPDRFDPERWAPEARAARAPFAYLPFSHGPHRCIGDGLAMVEGPLLLATLTRRWRARLTSTRPPLPLPLMTLVPASLPLRLERRSS